MSNLGRGHSNTVNVWLKARFKIRGQLGQSDQEAKSLFQIRQRPSEASEGVGELHRVRLSFVSSSRGFV